MSQAFSKIWIVVILIVLFAGGILAWQYLQVSKEEIKFTYNTGECEEGKEGIFEKFKIDSEANTILFEGFLNTYCNMKPKENLFMNYAEEYHEIDLKLIIDPKEEPIAKCICPFPVQGKIENLSSGKYKVNIIQEVLKTVEREKYVTQRETLQTEEVEIK